MSKKLPINCKKSNQERFDLGNGKQRNDDGGD